MARRTRARKPCRPEVRSWQAHRPVSPARCSAARSRRCAPRSTSSIARSKANCPPISTARSTASGRTSSIRRACPTSRFDGEGHIGMFRFANGHVDYKSRFVRTQRYKAQAAAREVTVRHLSQSVHRRPARQGPEPRHRQHRADVSPRQTVGAQGRQSAGGARSGHARDASTTTTPSAASSRASPSPRIRRSIPRPAR